MLGVFNSEAYLETIKNKKSGINTALKNVNRTLGTFYTMEDVIDYQALNEINLIFIIISKIKHLLLYFQKFQDLY